ncbi:nitroreductase [Haloferula luteola]|uniref:Putative NAD(P)H nitroreductase n=1 Tax=Haloferula luteola TaxID=595692 RepID=A0A840V4M8_9BACT|nr:nitroreductase [Haloferula luteola]MBB5352975.1 nitroreductase [Haloferula luteola]
MSIYRNRRTFKPVTMDPDKEVPRELLTDILEDAHWAPTHGLTQPWRFHVFTSPESRQRIATTLVDLYDQLTPENQQDPSKRKKLEVAPRRAPVVIALLAHVEPQGKIPEWEELAATSCAAQNLMLSAHEKGLGTFWSTPPVACSQEWIRSLGHDANHLALGLIYLGWPLENEPNPRSVRAPLAEHLFWHDKVE